MSKENLKCMVCWSNKNLRTVDDSYLCEKCFNKRFENVPDRLERLSSSKKKLLVCTCQNCGKTVTGFVMGLVVSQITTNDSKTSLSQHIGSMAICHECYELSNTQPRPVNDEPDTNTEPFLFNVEALNKMRVILDRVSPNKNKSED